MDGTVYKSCTFVSSWGLWIVFSTTAGWTAPPRSDGGLLSAQDEMNMNRWSTSQVNLRLTCSSVKNRLYSESRISCKNYCYYSLIDNLNVIGTVCCARWNLSRISEHQCPVAGPVWRDNKEYKWFGRNQNSLIKSNWQKGKFPWPCHVKLKCLLKIDQV